jgi:hypothetical protein
MTWNYTSESLSIGQRVNLNTGIPGSSKRVGSFAPKVPRNSYAITGPLASVAMRQGRASTLYSNIRSLARAIVDNSHLSVVSFNGGHPTVPLAHVDLDSFQFASRCDDYFPSAYLAEDPVDMR